jgi:hypothetical protein
MVLTRIVASGDNPVNRIVPVVIPSNGSEVGAFKLIGCVVVPFQPRMVVLIWFGASVERQGLYS